MPTSCHSEITQVTVYARGALVTRRVTVPKEALAALGYHVDPAAPRATGLEEVDFLRLGIRVKELPGLQAQADEVVAARTGGGVSLAVGMARVFSGLPGMNALLSYWYHFAIMFEALFILTTIDTGTRIGRFLMQEFLGRFKKELGSSTNRFAGVLATALIVAGWTLLILTNNIQTIWPMFGISNQLLACTALCVATTIVLKEAKKKRYALVTALPLVFVGTTTLTAAVQSVLYIYLPMTESPQTAAMGWANAGLTAVLFTCVLVILGGSIRRWVTLLRTSNVVPPTEAGA